MNSALLMMLSLVLVGTVAYIIVFYGVPVAFRWLVQRYGREVER